MHIYMQKRKHRDGGKKFHDILAAVAHLHDDALLWTRGFLHRERGQWGTDVGPFLDREKYDANCMISIDYNWSLDKIWKHVIEGE